MIIYENVNTINVSGLNIAEKILEIMRNKSIKTIDISMNALDNVEKSKPVPTLKYINNDKDNNLYNTNIEKDYNLCNINSLMNMYNYINTFSYFSTGIIYNEHPLIKILIQKRISSGIGTSSHIAAIVPDLLDERCYLLCKKGKDRDR